MTKYTVYKGQPQWLYNSNNGSGAVSTFPMSFPSACYAVVQCSGNTGRIEGNPYINSITVTQIKWGQYGLGYILSVGT